tara:strand:- start:20 stop:478 length:459 start_codon:yes stop_codon:yes gene_type:complete
MTWRKNKNHHTNYCAKWRNSSLGKTNPNHQYFSRLLKKETNDYLTSNKEYLLANEPEIYYSMKGQKLPKKYQQKQGIGVSPVNAYVPPQSKLNSNELRQENKRKEMIKQRNQNAYAREQNYIRWVNPFTPINHNKLGSSQSWKTEKKYKYYD